MKKLRKSIALCALFLLVLVLAGCSEKSAVRSLSETQIAEANLWFSGMVDSDDQNGSGEINCFFTSYYADPREIDLKEFLKYCPVGVMLTDADAEEFHHWAEAAQWPDAVGLNPSEFYVPVRRLANEDVSTVLMKYAGITAADLKSFGDAVYLEKYDAFYNFTSDYAPGHFECVGGETDGSVVRFWSETSLDGTRDVLTVKRVDSQYLICSFAQESAD